MESAKTIKCIGIICLNHLSMIFKLESPSMKVKLESVLCVIYAF